MALVTCPNRPPNGVSRWNEAARCQSTEPAATGMMHERKASPAEMDAMGMASLDAHRTPCAVKSGAKASASGVHTMTIPASVDKGDVPAAEADRIARFIRSEVDAKRRSFGDFLVLTRKRKSLALYAGALEAPVQ